LATDRDGNVYVADPEGKKIHRIDKEGKVSVFARTGAGVQGLCVGADGKLYAAQPQQRRIVVLDGEGKEASVAGELAAESLVVTRGGDLYCTVPGEGAVYRVGKGGEKTVVDRGLTAPHGLTLWADQGTLVVSEAEGKRLWTYRVEKDGSLGAREGYYPVWVPRGGAAGAKGLTIDATGRLYAATGAGVQVFDPTGRLSGVMTRPSREAEVAVAFGGPALDQLYVAAGDKLYVRKTQARGLPLTDKPKP
jgi:enterochelin esterase family protein